MSKPDTEILLSKLCNYFQSYALHTGWTVATHTCPAEHSTTYALFIDWPRQPNLKHTQIILQPLNHPKCLIPVEGACCLTKSNGGANSAAKLRMPAILALSMTHPGMCISAALPPSVCTKAMALCMFCQPFNTTQNYCTTSVPCAK